MHMYMFSIYMLSIKIKGNENKLHKHFLYKVESLYMHQQNLEKHYDENDYLSFFHI